MPEELDNPRAARTPAPGSGSQRLIGFIAVVATLYFGAEVLMPMALAALFAFLLAPIVNALHRRLRLPRALAVLVTVLLAAALFVTMAWVVYRQVEEMALSLPEYRDNIRRKIEDSGAVEALDKVERGLEDMLPADDPPTPPPDATAGTSRPPGRGGLPLPLSEAAKRLTGEDAAPPPIPVRIVGNGPSPLSIAGTALGPVMGLLGTVGIVAVLVIFMLFYRDDLRDRLLSLTARGRVVDATQALGEASRRISRYLLTTLLVNLLYGIPVGVGLALLGVPNPILWGLLATVLRFIPYIGPWIAAGLPVLLAFAITPGWSLVLEVLALFLVLELISNNLIEPWLYGKRTGLAPMAVILAAVFWTWLWGIVGLVLAVPLTLILSVIGKTVPELAFLDVLLGDEPPLAPRERLYQRLVAADAMQAAEVADTYLEEHDLQAVFDELVLPVVRWTRDDVLQGRLSSGELAALTDTLRELLDDLADKARGDDAPATVTPRARVLFLPLGDDLDALVGRMLEELVRADGITLALASPASMPAEMLELARQSPSDAIVISAFPRHVLRARALARRLAMEPERRRVVLAVWDAADGPALGERLRKTPAEVVVGLAQTAAALRGLVA